MTYTRQRLFWVGYVKTSTAVIPTPPATQAPFTFGKWFRGCQMLDRELLKNLVDTHGPCVRVVTAAVQGSGPREVGAAMVVWDGGQHGTIGGGTLEFEAAKAAVQQLHKGNQHIVSRHPLGPALGQCCGGAVTLVSERVDQTFLNALDGKTAYARRVEGQSDQPFAMRRTMAEARSNGQRVPAQLLDGWWIEPLHEAPRRLWIWGAGHVGRAIVDVLGPLPDIAITWVDTDRTRFPQHIPNGIDYLTAEDPALLVPHAPNTAAHLILTFSHSLDLSICHALLQNDFTFAGLIGSKTKWARFQKRLNDLGHTHDHIQRITCPIGDPTLGKHPQAIAIGVAAKLLSKKAEQLVWGNKTA